MQLFLSYARADRPQAESLALRLRQAGITTWLDSDLVGGQEWWDKILEQLRSCDAVLAAMSKACIKSEACRSERRYAAALGKPILPLTLEPLSAGMLPGDVARIQAIDYSQPDEAAAFKLIGAIYALPKPKPLPDPLPQPPAVPESYLGDLGDRIASPKLDMDEQLAIMARLEDALAAATDPRDRQTVAELTGQMATRPDLFASTLRRVERLQAQLGTQQAPPKDKERRQRGGTGQRQQYQPPPQPPPQPQAAQSAAGASPHWPLAITSAILTFITIILCPIGIVALVSASRVGTSLSAGNVTAARKASSRVVIAFWVTIALWVLLVIISVAAQGNNPNNGTGLGIIGHSILR